ncbi:uncharacterized protein BXZ73DRAFT_76789 [Epithele typhae]|uniref:uncharacterized protein n=1 Tax=Epithele typhae TaxID=378194 RepID=UPI002007A3ED|nr:uncharacterized protein BXZ73DRAFT_76789 [Epithele typhae]KAH9935986.1 hypothetical protein BXZ73DRAFT_76789 [Epithele typhae]
MRDALEKDRRIHRDISANNIILVKEADSDTRYLVDWETSCPIDTDGNAVEQGRTGTWRYMSIRVLRWKNDHEGWHRFEDDVESLLMLVLHSPLPEHGEDVKDKWKDPEFVYDFWAKFLRDRALTLKTDNRVENSVETVDSVEATSMTKECTRYPQFPDTTSLEREEAMARLAPSEEEETESSEEIRPRQPRRINLAARWIFTTYCSPQSSPRRVAQAATKLPRIYC